ncbi:MAG TPA: hypothetical protein VMM59_12030, partial [Thermohalobaculum sp.]|nr:hypothetical protein [Thermohalobaculum sp.]
MPDTPSPDTPSPDTSSPAAPPAPAPTGRRAWAGLLGPAVARRHRVAEGVWRSGQPGPARLRAFA